MKPADSFEFPPEEAEALRKARRVAWWSIGYLVIAVALQYLVAGSSQAMKTAWMEDSLSLIPPAVFLFASYAAGWRPNRDYPYGYHRAVSVAFLVAAVTLFSIGSYLLIESIHGLVTAEHPTMGGVRVFGHTVWLGWLVFPVLAWKVVPAVILGRAKLPLAKKIHDKVLFTDAQMNKADWMTGLAAMLGVAGIGLGWWWADAVAAAFISLDILHDGFANLREVGRRLMNARPRTVERKPDPLQERVRDWLLTRTWVEDAMVRLREEGHVYYGEAFVVPVAGRVDVDTLDETARGISDLDWRLHEVVIVPVKTLDDAGDPSGESDG